MKYIVIPIIIVSVILVTVVSILLFVIMKDQKGHTSVSEKIVPVFVEEQQYASPFTVESVTYNKADTVGQEQQIQYKAIVGLKNPLQTVPTAFQIKASYNKDNVQVNAVNVGNLWTDANVLMNTIDSSSGIIKFAAGQGFSADKNSQGKSLMVIDYAVKNGTPEDIDLVIYPESKFGYTDQTALRPLDPSLVIVRFE
jgi:uncharacterized protein YxeA